jgi:predicted HTH transcriptional regulator
MNNELFERLLYENESTTLDCKKEQYRFAKATDDEKSELLKDILGFANAWRRSEAYILIGVKEVRGGRSNVIGIPATDHLDDHALQQFVNNLTNQPVRFHYEAFGFEGKQVGIIRIDEQTRPIYLKKNYGKLKKNEVYVRRRPNQPLLKRLRKCVLAQPNLLQNCLSSLPISNRMRR